MSRKLLSLGLAGIVSITGGCLTSSSKDWIDNNIEERIVQYKQQDRQWTEKRIEKDKQWIKRKLEAELRLYEQQNEIKFEAKVPLEELANAFNSTYKVVNKAYYETREGNIISPGAGLGSGILLEGGYLLTAKHVIAERFPPEFSDHYWGLVKYHHNELSINGIHKLEKVVIGEYLDYALLKLKDSEDLPFYDGGLDTPKEVSTGTSSAAIGFSLGSIKNLRLGNVSQIDSNAGNSYFTFKNSIIFGDSGGPLFVIEDGKIKLAAISSMLTMMKDWDGVYHPTNIGYGLKLEVILRSLEDQRDLGWLDEETVKELENFLKLNSCQ